MNECDILPFCIGIGLIVGAVATHYGDRLWLGENCNRTLPPDEVEESNASRTCTIVIGLAGAALMIYAILRTMKVI